MARIPPRPINLHGARTGNCLRVSIALEELALPYRVIPVDVQRGEHKRAAHLALNPAGKIPVIVDFNVGACPFVLTQSNAILLHVAEKKPGRLLPVGSIVARGLAHERLFYFLTDVIAPSHGAFLLRREDQPDAAMRLETRARAMLARSERFLEDALFMAGDLFTLADIAAFTIAQAYEQALDWPSLPRLQRWFADDCEDW